MTKSSLKRKSSLIILLLIVFISCKQNNKSFSTRENIKNDTLFFKTDNIYGDEWLFSDRERANICRVSSRINDTLFEAKHFIIKSNKLLSKGRLRNIEGATPLSSSYEGTWFYYGDADIGLYKVGNYKKGIKEGSWYVSYEDTIPEIFYYENDNIIEYNDSIEIFDDGKKIIAKGKGVSSSGLPKNTWWFYFFNSNIKSQRVFSEEGDKVKVVYRDFEITTNKLIEEGSFEEER